MPETESLAGTKRLFLALEMPAAVREELGRLVKLMRPLESAVKYVAESNMHLTLKFLGNVEAEVIDLVALAARDVVKDARPFEFRVSSLGAFPGEDRPRVLWAGFQDGGEALALQTRLEEAMGPLGFPKEGRPFRAHLTIGRVRVPVKRPGLMNWLDRNRHREFGEGRAEEVVLFESRLRPEGPIYAAIERLPFPVG